jgi:hypothetical protein
MMSNSTCTREITIRIAMIKVDFNRKKTLFTLKLDLNLRNKLVTCYIWSTALCGAEMWTFRKADQKYLERFEMWCKRRMEKIIRADRVRNEDVLHRFKEKRNILHKTEMRKTNCMSHIE